MTVNSKFNISTLSARLLSLKEACSGACSWVKLTVVCTKSEIILHSPKRRLEVGSLMLPELLGWY